MGMTRSVRPKGRHPPWIAALLFIIALCVAPVLAAAEGSAPSSSGFSTGVANPEAPSPHLEKASAATA